MFTKLFAAAAILSVSALGCTTQVSDPTPAPETDSVESALHIQKVDNGIVGTFSQDQLRVDFSSKMVEPSVFDIVVTLNGMTITALVDQNKGLMEYDGFASDNGEDTQMGDPDRKGVLQLTRALDGLGETVDEPTRLLRGFTSTWAEFPSTLDMQLQAFAEQDKSYYSLCGYCGWYVQATHDCWDYDRNDDASTYYAHVSMLAGGSCSDSTYFWNGSSWICYEPDHSTSVEYAYGDCFGRCGAGCGSSSQMTWDCLDHDSCVRFGHDMASFWCDDEFTSTVDDWAAAPNCGSTCGM